MAKTTIKKEKELEKMEETKVTENEQEQEDQGVENPPAEVDEKKGFHPIQFVKTKATEFADKHPKIASGVKTGAKVAGGVVLGAVGTVAVLATVAAKKGDESVDDEDIDLDELEDDDENIIDSEATEVDD